MFTFKSLSGGEQVPGWTVCEKPGVFIEAKFLSGALRLQTSR